MSAPLDSATAAGAARRTARGSVADLLRGAARVDRTQSDPAVALRNAVGIAAPLAIGTLAGTPALGLASTIGALQTAFADRPGPYRLRMLRMLGTALAAAVTSALAVLASRNDAAAVLLLLVLAFAAGLLLAAGPAAAQTGTAAVAAALVIGHIPHPPSVALHVGLLVLAGGAGQALLAVAAWPLRRHRPERLALAALYRELAGVARAPAGTGVGPPAGDRLTAVRATLYGLGHDHGPAMEAYRVLLDEAERIRREIVVVAGTVERLAGEGDDRGGPAANAAADATRAALTAVAGVLDAVADALERGRPVRTSAGEAAAAAIDAAVRTLESGTSLTRRTAAARLRALRGQLRAALESSDTGATEGSNAGTRDQLRQRLRRAAPAVAPAAIQAAVRTVPSATRELALSVRATVAPDSAVLRHALRTAVLVAGSDLVVRLAGIDRGYWVSLTVLVVLRPDFGATLQRAVLRTVGTVVGLVLATVLLHWVPGGDWWTVALMLVFAFGMRLAGPNNFGLTALSLSALVVVLLSIAGVPAHQTLVARSIATLAGGLLAVVAVLAFPTWERDLLPARLAAMLGAYADYVRAVADLGAGRERLGAARAASRRSRTNAQASLDRAAAEPVPATAALELGRAVLAHSHRVVHAALAVDAVRVPVREAGGTPELPSFLAAAAAGLTAAQRAVETGRAPALRPDVRERQQELDGVLDARPDVVGGAATAAVLADASDRMANGVDTLLAELRRQLAVAPATAVRTAQSASRATDGGTAIPGRRSGAGSGGP